MRVMQAIADHDRPLGVEPFGSQDMADQFALVGPRSIQRGAMHAAEEPGEAEMVDDVERIGFQLGRRDKQRVSGIGHRLHTSVMPGMSSFSNLPISP